MKNAIIYCSRHHGNTKQVLDAIAGAAGNVTLIDAQAPAETDLSGYDLIGFASGIYFSKFHKTVLAFAQEHLPENKPVFFLYTCGAEKSGYTKAIAEIAGGKHARVLGEYGCLGYDTYGPFKLVGGIAKGHPDSGELAGAVSFFHDILRKAEAGKV